MEYFVLALLGASMGSFVGALTWRLKHGMNFVSDRSICEHCEHVLSWHDLLPVVSWLSLGGKCRYCKKPIGVQALLLEMVVASLFVGSFIFWPFALGTLGSYALLGSWLMILTLLVTLFVYDLRWLLLPNSLVAALAVAVLLFRIFEVASGESIASDLLRASALGALVGGGFFYVLFQISRGKWIGGGDVKLGFVIGALLGPARAAVGLLLGFYSAALIVLPLMAIGKVGRKAQIPFGPFLILGFVISFFWGEDIRQTYLELAGFN